MKRIICLLTVTVLLVALTACGGGGIAAGESFANEAMGVSLTLPKGASASVADDGVITLTLSGSTESVPCITIRRYNVPPSSDFFASYTAVMGALHKDDAGYAAGTPQSYSVGKVSLLGNAYVYEHGGAKIEEFSLLKAENGWSYLITSVRYAGGESIWEALEYVAEALTVSAAPADPQQAVSIALAPNGVGSQAAELPVKTYTNAAFGYSFEAPECVPITEKDDCVYIYPCAEGSLPYVMVYRYPWAGSDAAAFFTAFDDALLTQSPEMKAGALTTLAIAGKEYPGKTYAYSVQGYEALDSRIVIFESGFAYMLTSRELPSEGMSAGKLLEQIAASFTITPPPAPSPEPTVAPEATAAAE